MSRQSRYLRLQFVILCVVGVAIIGVGAARLVGGEDVTQWSITLVVVVSVLIAVGTFIRWVNRREE